MTKTTELPAKTTELPEGVTVTGAMRPGSKPC